MYRVLLLAGVLICFSPWAAKPLSAQISPAPASIPEPSLTQDGVKSPGTATLLSVLVPGGGQMYADKTGKGLALFGVASASLIGGVALSASNCSVYECSLTPFYVGGLMYLGTWMYSMATASHDAEDHNARLRRTTPYAVMPWVAIAKTGRTNIGVRLALGH